jgi:phasin family protein
MAKKPDADPFTSLFTKFGKDLKMPGMDVQAILDHHRKNFEALQKSASVSASGAQSIMAKQRDMLQETMREITAMAENLRSAGSPQEAMNRQVDFARRSFERAVENTSEVGEIAKKSGTESVEVLRERIKDMMQEIRASYEAQK